VIVMAGLVPAIHAFECPNSKTSMPATSAGMTFAGGLALAAQDYQYLESDFQNSWFGFRQMKIFLAGAGGAIGRRLTPLLRAAGHAVVGTTRSKDKAAAIAALGAEPVVVDVFDAEALARAVKAAAPQLLMHQLTDLPFAPGTPRYDEGLERNARLRIEGTRAIWPMPRRRPACGA
jgi:NADPH:quinone reductase-like Zn-dependent oxidoreductase